MDFIYSELDTALLNISPDIEKDIFYYGAIKSFPNLDTFPLILPELDQQPLTAEVFDTGLVCEIITSGGGQYEVMFYPAKYGDIVYINQNFVGINVIAGWEKEVLEYRGRRFYLFHTKNLQYSDRSTFAIEFKI